MNNLPTKNKNEKPNWNWATYFAAKKQKLELQFNSNKEEAGDFDLDKESRVLFKGVCIFVNGYTNPTSIELKTLMIKYGGLFYEYYNEKVTHIIASNLAHSKTLLMKSKLIVKPEWILDCIKEKKLLNTEPYLVLPIKDKNQNKLTDYVKDRVLKSPIKKKIRSEDKEIIIRKKSDEIRPKDTRNDDIIEISKDLDVNKKQPESESVMSSLEEYECFQNKINNFELPNYINQNQSKHELELERIKHLLADWIVWTSKDSLKTKDSEQIDIDDLQIFKGYLIYLLNNLKDFEKLVLIIKILKRLIQKNGTHEWIDAYKEICSSIQAEFYIKYNKKLKLE